METIPSFRTFLFRHRPTEISAIRYTDWIRGLEISQWCDGYQHIRETLEGYLVYWLTVPDRHDDFVIAEIGDFILQDREGYFSVMKAEEFVKHYEVSIQ